MQLLKHGTKVYELYTGWGLSGWWSEGRRKGVVGQCGGSRGFTVGIRAGKAGGGREGGRAAAAATAATFEEEDRRWRALMYELAPRIERDREGARRKERQNFRQQGDEIRFYLPLGLAGYPRWGSQSNCPGRLLSSAVRPG